MPSVFAHMLRGERYLPPKGRRGDFSIPMLGETTLPKGQDPLLVTNARGWLVPTHTSSSGVARFGFSFVVQSEEVSLFHALLEVLRRQQGSLRCRGVPMALERLQKLGIEAATIVVSEGDARVMLGMEEPVLEGFVGTVGKMKVLVSDMEKGTALVAVAPEHLGVYTRVTDYLGLLFQRIDRSMVVVDDVA